MATESPPSTLAGGTDQTTNHSSDPPLLSITIPKLKDLQVPFKSWELAELPTDVLLLTVEDTEFLACYFYLDNAYKSNTKGLGRVYFGEIGDGLDKVKVSLIRCNRGSVKAGASHNVVRNAVDCLQPKAVFSVGFCGGLRRGKAKLGDVVISGKLSTYADKQIINDREQWCGNTVNVSKNIGDLIKYAADGWKAPLNDPEVLEIQVHRNAEILTGLELVKCPEKSEELLKQFPGATAIEFEGQGVFAAAFDCELEWVIIKGISHFADGSECGTKEWKSFASVMAAAVVQNILKEPDILNNWPHYNESVTRLSRKNRRGIPPTGNVTSATVPDGKPRTKDTALIPVKNVEVLRGMELKKKEATGKVTLRWKQGSFFGIGGDRSQTYNVFTYETTQSGKVFVYIQDGYDSPDKMICDKKLQFGMNDGVFFLVYHDKEQTPFQHRFIQNDTQKKLYEANDWLKSNTMGIGDLSWVSGDYLRDF